MPAFSGNTSNETDVIVPEQPNAEDVQHERFTRETLESLHTLELLKFYGLIIRYLNYYRLFGPIRTVLENPVVRTPATANGVRFPRTCDSCGAHLLRASFTTPSIAVADLCPTCFCYLSLQDAHDFSVALTPSSTLLHATPDGAPRLQGAVFVPGACELENRCTVCNESPTRHCFRGATGDVQCVKCYIKVEGLATTFLEQIVEILQFVRPLVGTVSGDAFYHCLCNDLDPLEYVTIPSREEFIRHLEGEMDPEEIRVFYIGEQAQ